MADTGSQADMVWRLGKVLPARWFPDPVNAPVLQSVLNGLGAGLAAIYSQISYASNQTRITTATDAFLDIASLDYLGGSLPRRAGELDGNYRTRVLAEIIRPRATRASVIRVLTDLTGRAPTVFEPANPHDTGGIGSLGMTAGTGLAIGASSGTTGGAGGIGSIEIPNQFFVNALRATVGGIPNVGGIRSLSSTGWAGGGIGSLSNNGAGAGAMEITTLSMSQGQITDDLIYAAVASVLPAGGIAWVSITT